MPALPELLLPMCACACMLCVCMWWWMCVCVHVVVRACVCMCACACMLCVCMVLCMCWWMCVCVCVCVCVLMNVCVCTCACIYASMKWIGCENVAVGGWESVCIICMCDIPSKWEIEFFTKNLPVNPITNRSAAILIAFLLIKVVDFGLWKLGWKVSTIGIITSS